MAVRAYNLALLYLFEDALPVAIRQGLADVEFLALEVVELEDHRVLLPAIHAWVAFEEREQVRGPLARKPVLADPCLIDVPLLVQQVVRPVICRPAGPAHVVALPSVL